MISLIAAYARGRVIGKDGRLPWRLPDDLRYFRRVTLGHTVVMGRKTFDAIGRPLPGRRNVVLTRGAAFAVPGVEVAHSVDDVVALGDIVVIGGASVYALFLPLADRLYITEIDADIAGDTYFPEWDPGQFACVRAREGVLDAENALRHRFLLYERSHPGGPDQSRRARP